MSSCPYKRLIVNQPFGHHVHLFAVLGDIVAFSSKRLLELSHRHAAFVLALRNHAEDELGDLR